VGAAVVEDENEDPPRKLEKRARSDGQRTAGVAAWWIRRLKGERTREGTSTYKVGTFSHGLNQQPGLKCLKTFSLELGLQPGLEAFESRLVAQPRTKAKF
jgi:hypothetical protein